MLPFGERDDLTSLAWRLHVSLSRNLQVGELGVFATALLISVSPRGRCRRGAVLWPSAAASEGEIAEWRSSRSDRRCRRSGCPSSARSTPGLRFGLRPGDGLLLYTDGFTEARDARGEFFPLARCAACAEPADLMQRLVDDLAAHAGDRLGDDAALVLLRRHQADRIDVDHQVQHSATP
jgi:hypothetical protein